MDVSDWGIPIWEPSDPQSISTFSGVLATALDEVLGSRAITTFSWANQTEQDNETRMVPGSEGYREDLGAFYVYSLAGVWVRRHLAGLTPIKPSAVAASAGTVSFVGNRVVVSQVPGTLRLDGIFTSEFTNYKILVDMESVSVTGALSLVFSAAGTPDNGANYDFARLYQNATTPAATSTAASPATAITLTAGSVTRISSVMELAVAGAEPRKTVSAQSSAFIATGTPFTISCAAQYRPATVVDGIQLLMPASAVAGANVKVSVFGYNNAL